MPKLKLNYVRKKTCITNTSFYLVKKLFNDYFNINNVFVLKSIIRESLLKAKPKKKISI